MSLETYTTRQLIEELTSRPTFVGFVVKSRDEAKEEISQHRSFELFNGNLKMEQTLEIMANCGEEMKAFGYNAG